MKRWKKLSVAILALIATVLQSACMGVPEGVDVVDGFELDRYLGTWYEIARLDHSFERGMSNITATYSLRDDGGVAVVNRGYKVAKGEWDDAEGKAYFVGESDVGRLKVSFFGPFYGAYNIIELDKENYEYSMVVGPDSNYLWILARSPDIHPDLLTTLVEKARRLNFPVDEIIYVDHAGIGNAQ
jgi:apolipoprotein D and lipocalin family protein